MDKFVRALSSFWTVLEKVLDEIRSILNIDKHQGTKGQHLRGAEFEVAGQ